MHLEYTDAGDVVGVGGVERQPVRAGGRSDERVERTGGDTGERVCCGRVEGKWVERLLGLPERRLTEAGERGPAAAWPPRTDSWRS